MAVVALLAMASLSVSQQSDPFEVFPAGCLNAVRHQDGGTSEYSGRSAVSVSIVYCLSNQEASGAGVGGLGRRLSGVGPGSGLWCGYRGRERC